MDAESEAPNCEVEIAQTDEVTESELPASERDNLEKTGSEVDIPLMVKDVPEEETIATQIEVTVGETDAETGHRAMEYEEEAEETLLHRLENLSREVEEVRENAAKDREKCESFRRQKDSALEERDALVDMITRLNSEIVHLKDLQSKTAAQLKNAIDSNFEVLAKNDELKTKELSLAFREELMEHEKVVIDDTIRNLNQELNKKKLELENVKISQSSKMSTLEIQLTAKTEELAIADRDIAYLRNERLNLVAEVESLNKKLEEQRETENKICDDLRKKLSAKTKVADLYKSMRDDSDSKCEELVKGVTELQKLLNEAVEKYGELESKNLQMEMDREAVLRQKNNMISSLKEDLENVRLELATAKAEKISIALKDISPSAAIAREFVRSGMSLTEIYSRLINVSDELEKKSNENTQLKEAFNAIIEELEENAPFIRSQLSQNRSILEDHSAVVHQLESMEMEYNQLRGDYAEAMKLSNHFERENKRLKDEMTDLSRQVCFLLKEIELNRGNDFFMDKDVSTGTSSSELNSSQIISKNLVTFSNVQELQANNQKLLKLVRDLAEKQEEAEALQEQYEMGELQAKLNELNDKVKELTDHNDRQTKSINNVIKQRDMYKKLLANQSKTKAGSADVSEKDIDLEESNIEESGQNKDDHISRLDLTNKIKALELEINETKIRLNQQEEDHKKYESLTDSKEKVLLNQIDKLKKDLFDLNDTYRKCACTAEANSEKCKMLQFDLVAQKRKNTTLEERSEKINSKLAEYEMTIRFLQERVSVGENKLSENETTLNNLRKEYKLSKEMKDKLLSERDALNEELRNQSVLIANFGSIKKLIEEKQSGEKSKLEAKLDEFTRECSLLRRKIQEKDAIFSDNLSPQGSKFGEKTDVEKLRLELTLANEEIQIKSQHIRELSETLSSGDGKYLKDEIKNLKHLLDEKQLEVNALTQQVADNKEYMKQFTVISENAEKELKKLNDEFLDYKNISESKRIQNEVLIENLKEKCSELEAELSLQNTNQDELLNHMKSQLCQAEENIKIISLQLTEKSLSLEEIKNENSILNEKLTILSEENINMNINHTESVQKISQLQSEISSLNRQIVNLSTEKIEQEDKFKNNEILWNNKYDLLNGEKEQLETHFTELKHQNVLLHEQIEALNSQYIMSQSFKNDEQNESVASVNTSATYDNDTKSHLLQIIKYLRKERDLHSRKLDEAREENVKMKTDIEILQNELTNVKNLQLKNISDLQANISLTSHSELIEKVEMLNEMSVSNTLLRDERDKLLGTIEKSNHRIKELEDATAQLRTNNDSLTKKINSLVVEKNCISTECSRWKNKISTLLEKTNKTNPEDWKRLQNERETLAKMLTTEKENVKKVREELILAKIEKNRLEEQITTMNSQLGNVNELKNDINQLSSELTDAKTALKEKTEEILKLNENLSATNTSLADSRSKELQIKKIARQYKSQYETLFQSVEEEKKKSEQNAAESSSSNTKSDTQKELEQKIIELEKSSFEKTTELEAQVTSSLEENDNLQKEIEILKTKNENIEEKAKLAIKQAKTKISFLTESRDNLTRELTDVKAKVEIFEQNKDENDVRLAALKSQYEGRINKLEKEKNQILQTQQNETTQLNKQIETLTQRLVQLQKQIDNQSAKPSTSSNQGEKSNVEPPTANIKPMAGAQTSAGNRRIGADTPLASIKPMTSVPAVRTAAVLPTTASSHQSPHTTGNTIGEVISSSPSSSHGTEYLPSSSSTNRLHLLHSQNVHLQSTPLHSAPPESTQDLDSEMNLKSETTTINNTVTGFQQTVALVSPRMETPPTDNNVVQPTSSSNSSSNSTVTTSHTNITDRTERDNAENSNKRIREEFSDEKPNTKRTKVEVSKSNECEAEYQVPTSSQKDQEDDSVIVVDSEDEESECEQQDMYSIHGMRGDRDEEDEDDEEVEDEDDEEDDDSDEEKSEDEMEEEEMMAEEEDEDEDGMEAEERDQEFQNDDEMEELDDDVETTDKERRTSDQSNVELIDDTSQEGDEDKENDPRVSTDKVTSRSFTTNETLPHTSRNLSHSNQSSFLTLRPSGSGIHSNVATGSYEEGDDSIVPSTPTLYVPARNDGFGEAVRSPTVDARNSGRFSFNPSNSSGVMENTHADLTLQLSSRQNEGDQSSSNPNMAGDVENFDNNEANEAARNLDSAFS